MNAVQQNYPNNNNNKQNEIYIHHNLHMVLLLSNLT
jgi:hypothetical protein